MQILKQKRDAFARMFPYLQEKGSSSAKKMMLQKMKIQAALY
jgi:hypothetical protein